MNHPCLPLLAALLLLAACHDGKQAAEALTPAPGGKAAPVTLTLPVTGGTRDVLVELAITNEQRNMGLMNRTRLAEDAGMLFVFATDQPRTFWMRNTYLPLDILFLDADGTVQNIVAAQPGVEKPGYHSLRPARMVLELNRGWCASHGLVPGAKIPVPAELLALPKD